MKHNYTRKERKIQDKNQRLSIDLLIMAIFLFLVLCTLYIGQSYSYFLNIYYIYIYIYIYISMFSKILNEHVIFFKILYLLSIYLLNEENIK